MKVSYIYKMHFIEYKYYNIFVFDNLKAGFIIQSLKVFFFETYASLCWGLWCVNTNSSSSLYALPLLSLSHILPFQNYPQKVHVNYSGCGYQLGNNVIQQFKLKFCMFATVSLHGNLCCPHYRSPCCFCTKG